MKKINRFIYWTPRILSLLFVLFLTIFSLDIFEMNLGFWGTILGLFIHNIPPLLLLIIIIISWKYEIVGGIIFILFGALYTLRTFISSMMSGFDWHMALAWSLQIAGPAFLIGILYLINWYKKKK